jgi:site-specific DNA recombinase
MKERSKQERCQGQNANGIVLDEAIIGKIKCLPEQGSGLVAQLEKSRQFYTGNQEQYETQLKNLREEYATNEKTIDGLIDSLAMVGDSVARPRVLKRIEALTTENQDIENRIHELEALCNVNTLGDDEFVRIRKILSDFRTSVEEMSVEEKRAAIRVTVRKVIWDGVNAHVVLKGASEDDMELSTKNDPMRNSDSVRREEEWREKGDSLGKSKTRWGEDSK